MTVAPGAVVVAGGKYTTYRVMAADAVDAAVAELGEAADPVPASTTERIPLLLPNRIRRRIGELPFGWLREIARGAGGKGEKEGGGGARVRVGEKSKG